MMNLKPLVIVAVTVLLCAAASSAQTPAAGTANPELVGQLTQALGSTPQAG